MARYGAQQGAQAAAPLLWSEEELKQLYERHGITLKHPRHALQWLRLAETKLFSSNSSSSDLQDSVDMLLEVADALQQQLRPGAAQQRAATAASSSKLGSGSAHGSSGVGAAVRLVVVGPEATSAQVRELSWLETAAVAGNVDAQLALADRYTLGRGGVAASCTRGLAWLAPAARSLAAQAEQEGSIDAAPGAIFLRERWQDAASPARASVSERQLSVELEADAAIHADAYSLRRLGYRRLMGRGVPADPVAAFQDFIAAADGGDGYAWHNLGVMLLQGGHVQRNPSKALTYFQRALDRGVAAAANALGVMHAVGVGVPASMAAARSWFEQGANMSSSEAYFNLGTVYLHGLGVAPDAAAAAANFKKAHSLGHWKAALPIAELHMKAAGNGGLGYNCELASHHLWQFVSQRPSVWSNLMDAALRDYYATGTYVARPSPQATQQAAAAGTADTAAVGVAASSPLPSMRLRWGQRYRLRQALLRFLLMAESGSEAGSANAAWMLMRGEGAGGPDAVDAAAELLLRAAMLNHTSSMVQLGQVLVESAQVLLASTQQQGSTAAAATELMLHYKLQQQPNTNLPPVGGVTKATGHQRPPLPALLQQIRAPCSSSGSASNLDPPGSLQTQQQQELGSIGAEDACEILQAAWRAAVGWLAEGAHLGDVEAAAQLAWLWQRGEVLPANATKADRLMDRWV
ncbi:hypothetical protein OEZ86_007603 [Tetradesmus obliquus]|nr:hypothetical protein OEZ86_007603 [Tetradesmus obliquus]